MIDLGWPLVAELLLLGTVTGFMAGLLGVGGGMMMVPFMTWILSSRGVEPGLAVKMAIATSMATILFTSMSSVRAHHARGAVRWDLLRSLAPGIVIGGLLSGAGLFAVLKGRGLALFFAVFVGFSALQLLLDRKPAPTRQMPGAIGQTAVGGVIGLLSGLVGAGGAFMSVPFMIWCNVPIRQAVGTSAALGFPIALANTLGYLIAGRSVPAALPGAIGYLYLPALAIIAAASVTLAPLGARVAHGTDTAKLKRVFALLLFGLAAYMLHTSRSA
ncbi:MAG: sulfite exporter TauE/SafE family protein [Rubrivivax sp.]|nr:sulfite exporter TauE/SafE family protein [Rubrivivax sp.]MBK8527012.1 sulfite exporter TauE/SafE family protein [Rubrivivax sp.]